MEESSRRRVSRYLAAVMVLMAHLAFIAALMMAPGNGRLAASTANSVQLLYVAPVYPPKVSTVMANLPRRNNLNIRVEPPVLESLSFPPRSRKAHRGTARDREWTGRRKRGAPCRHSKFATTSPQPVNQFQRDRRTITGGRGRTMRVRGSRPLTATGSCGSMRTATKSPARDQGVRACRAAHRAYLPRSRRRADTLTVGLLADERRRT